MVTKAGLTRHDLYRMDIINIFNRLRYCRVDLAKSFKFCNYIYELHLSYGGNLDITASSGLGHHGGGGRRGRDEHFILFSVKAHRPAA